MSTTIESLELEIVSKSASAAEGVDALTQSLSKVKYAAKGGLGLSSVVKQLNNVSNSSGKASKSFTDFYHKLKTVAKGIKNVGKSIYSAIEKSSDYIENVNLFTVSMGKYADEAKQYAESVGEIMGIDPGEWMESQGIFMTLATGFGVAGDRAAVMSQNLTQLGYDLSSFFNISYDDAMQKLQSGLSGELEPLRRIGYDLSQAKLEATALELGIDKAVSSMTQAEKAELRYYAIMTQVTTAHGDMARTLDEPANQIRVFKAQLSMAAREIGNVFIPALNAILPYAIAVVKVIRTLVASLASLVGFEMPEVDYSGVASMGNVAEDTSGSLEDAANSAKKLKSYMLGFDELNVINPNTSDSSEDASGGFDFELPTLEDITKINISTKVNEIVEMIEDSLAEITLVLSGAGLAIGAVLAFSGLNIPLGIALMAAGAIGLGTTLALNWSSLESPLETALGTLGGIVGGALLATGAILAFTGVNIPLGIAMIAGGAVALTTAIALNWESLSEPMRQAIGTLAGIVGGALLVTGALMAFSGVNIPMGIALMVAGAVSLASAVALNWGALTGDVQGAVNTLTTIVSGAVLGVGAILAFTGVNIPLGIGLMAVGALTMGSAIALNTKALSYDVRETIAIITSAVSVALLAVGAILAFSGANIPLGIALMAGGALAMGTAVLPNWYQLSNSTVETITTILGAVGGAALVVGAILAFSGANIPLGIGLMAVGALSLATALSVNWDSIVTALKGPVGKITAIISGALLVLGAILLFTGVGIPLGIGLMLAGAAGLGTVVAVNWDFIVDKIKEIWENIKKFWNTYIAPIFTMEWWLNLGKTCINGLIAGYEWGINGIISIFEKMINWIVGGLNKISFDVPDWVPGIGGKRFGFNIPEVSFGRVSIPRLAEGAYDIPSGQMFIAREAGAEMVGTIGRKTAVANNDQIVSGIAGGVAEANEEQNVLLREQNSLLRAILEKDSGVYLDGKNLTNSVEKYQRERGRVLITGGVI